MILPAILNIPKKLLEMVKRFNEFAYFLLEGGRGSAKSHSAARFILFLCEKLKVRVICGRETQNSIEESVYQLFVDIVIENNLAFTITKSQITHKKSGSTIRFKGFREQGAVNIKSLEGCDILWIEEAQSITQATLDIILPTIRKQNSKVFFTMNRFIRSDPVYEFCAGNKDALTIHIDYFDNPFCPEKLKVQAEECKHKEPKKYKHIWLGQPLDKAEEFLFNFDKLADSYHVEPFGDLYKAQSVLGIDFAAGGGDLCVATHLVRTSMVHWEMADQIAWDETDTDASIGKSINIYGSKHPDIFIVDKGGLGYPMFMSISKAIPKVIGFDGAETKHCQENAGNHRAEAYLEYAHWVDNKWLRQRSRETIAQCETIRKKYHRNGKIYIESKVDMKNKRQLDSPDRSDSTAIAVFGAKHYLGKAEYTNTPIGQRVTRVNKRKRL